MEHGAKKNYSIPQCLIKVANISSSKVEDLIIAVVQYAFLSQI